MSNLLGGLSSSSIRPGSLSQMEKGQESPVASLSEDTSFQNLLSEEVAQKEDAQESLVEGLVAEINPANLSSLEVPSAKPESTIATDSSPSLVKQANGLPGVESMLNVTGRGIEEGFSEKSKPQPFSAQESPKGLGSEKTSIDPRFPQISLSSAKTQTALPDSLRSSLSHQNSGIQSKGPQALDSLSQAIAFDSANSMNVSGVLDSKKGFGEQGAGTQKFSDDLKLMDQMKSSTSLMGHTDRSRSTDDFLKIRTELKDLDSSLKLGIGEKKSGKKVTSHEPVMGLSSLNLGTRNPNVMMTEGFVTQGTAERPVLSHDAIHRIVENIQVIQKTSQEGEVRVKLRPDHMGEIQMKIASSANGQVQIEIHAADPKAKRIIEESLSQLKDSLGQAQISLGKIEIQGNSNAQTAMNSGMDSSSSQSSGMGFEQSAGQGGQNLSQSGRDQSFSGFEEQDTLNREAELSRIRNPRMNRGSDGRVDLMAS